MSDLQRLISLCSRLSSAREKGSSISTPQKCLDHAVVCLFGDFTIVLGDHDASGNPLIPAPNWKVKYLVTPIDVYKLPETT